MSSPSGSEAEASSAATSKKQLRRSSKRTAKAPVETVPRIKKRAAATDKKNTKSASSSSDEDQPIVSKTRGRGRPRLTTKTVEKLPVLPDTKTARGRGRPGTRGKNISGRGVKPARKGGNLYFWGKAPPTTADLAALGAKDGCKYALTTKGRAGARNQAYAAQSRSTRAAQIAVANLYDSD